MIIPEKKTAEEAMENPKPANEEAEEKTSTNDASPKEDSKDDDDGASASSGENVPADTTIAATSLPTAWVQQQKEKRRAERTPAPSSTKDQRAIFTPEPMDILLGRGRRLQEHRGNVRFRRVINRCRNQYLTSDRCEKRGLAEHIVRLMKEKSRFLKRITRIDGKEMWIEVSDQVATEKVSHALREKKIPDQHRQGGGSAASIGADHDDSHPTYDDDVEEDIAALQAGRRKSSSKKDRPKKNNNEDDVEPSAGPSGLSPEDVTSDMAEHARAQQLLAGRQNPLDTLASLATVADAPPYPMMGVPAASVLPSSAAAAAAMWPRSALGIPMVGGLGGAAAAEIAAQRQLLAAELAAAHRARILAGIDYPPLALGAGAAGSLLLPERRQLPLHMMSNEQLVGIVAQTRLLDGGRRAGQLPPGLY